MEACARLLDEPATRSRSCNPNRKMRVKSPNHLSIDTLICYTHAAGCFTGEYMNTFKLGAELELKRNKSRIKQESVILPFIPLRAFGEKASSWWQGWRDGTSVWPFFSSEKTTTTNYRWAINTQYFPRCLKWGMGNPQYETMLAAHHRHLSEVAWCPSCYWEGREEALPWSPSFWNIPFGVCKQQHWDI